MAGLMDRENLFLSFLPVVWGLTVGGFALDSAYGQSTASGYPVPDDQKIGGVCFRVDDDQSISNWYAYA
ncbi:MAG TPA: hypothetical protein VLX91_12315, partial [Candidatus Acidoferrales bacterium]|nr:hypothetical protein [Candidatus Acidoferrales bacterium]